MNDPNKHNAPLFKNWNYWYLLVIAFLGILIFLFNILTKRFA